MRIRKFLPLAAAIGLGVGAGCRKAAPAEGAPGVNVLGDAIDRNAEKALPAPTLAGEDVVLTASDIEGTAGEVARAAAAAGGTGVKSEEGVGKVSVLASIPKNNVEAFKAALHHETRPMATPAKETTLIEVLISHAAAASPTP